MKNNDSASVRNLSAIPSENGQPSEGIGKSDALEAMASTLEEYASSLRKSAAMLREGRPEEEALFEAIDVAHQLAFDADEITELLGLDYVDRKCGAIVSVEGVAATLAFLAENVDNARPGRRALQKLSEELMRSARTLDNYANRCDLYGGLA